MAATTMLRRFATAPPSVLLERTQKNVVAFAKVYARACWKARERESDAEEKSAEREESNDGHE